MTYVSVITFVAYGLVLLILAAITVIDMRQRRIPNVLSGGLAALWLAWRVVLGFAGEHMGLGFGAEFMAPAPTVLVPPGLEIVGASCAGGIIGAVILGGGLLILTALYEAVTHKESFGGGDIKLMAALGLFLGAERGLICLLAACVLSLVYAGVRHVVLSRAPRADESETGLQATMPFGPFIALGTLVAFVS